jgi:hydrophobe/amphiphile efflux-1 (HAE1) family protein
MLSGFFIHRPKFAIVIPVVITLAGLLALSSIPVSQYPNITPPQVTVSASYPGASAETVAKLVGQPIEEQVNGTPDMLYMQSTSSSSGTYSLQVTFAIGTDSNIDQVNVQNRVQLAQALLPTEVAQEGLSIRAASSNFVLAVNLFSENNKYDQVFISNYAYMHLQQVIARTAGVGNTQIFGQRQYAMRVWMDPVRMTSVNLPAADVISAIQSQNIQVAAGQIGQPPVSGNQQQQLTILAPGQLSTPEQFENIIVRANQNGGVVRIRDVGSVELAAQQYSTTSDLDGSPSATLAIYQAPDANALAVARSIEQQMAALAKQFPPGLKYAVVYSTTNFVSANIVEITRTLVIALILVVLVVFLFLQDWRATLIPTIAIPVSLIGVFAVLYVPGYSANTVDLFATVLAITLVVDDAIVVVENVTRTLEEEPDLPVAEATERAMAEITGPVVATTLILVAVFAPGVRFRRDRRAVPAVRRDHLRLGGHLRDQCPDAQPGALRASVPTAKKGAVLCIPLVQPWVRRGPQRLWPHRQPDVEASAGEQSRHRRRPRGHLPGIRTLPDGLSAERGSGLFLRQCPDPERRIPGPHVRGGEPGR